MESTIRKPWRRGSRFSIGIARKSSESSKVPTVETKLKVTYSTGDFSLPRRRSRSVSTAEASTSCLSTSFGRNSPVPCSLDCFSDCFRVHTCARRGGLASHMHIACYTGYRWRSDKSVVCACVRARSVWRRQKATPFSRDGL